MGVLFTAYGRIENSQWNSSYHAFPCLSDPTSICVCAELNELGSPYLDSLRPPGWELVWCYTAWHIVSQDVRAHKRNWDQSSSGINLKTASILFISTQLDVCSAWTLIQLISAYPQTSESRYRQLVELSHSWVDKERSDLANSRIQRIASLIFPQICHIYAY